MKFVPSLRGIAVLTAGLIASVAFAANQTSSLPQELWPGSPVSSGTSLSRAEVRADLQVWKQAGMDRFGYGDGISFDSADYERRLRHYQELRQSPAFQTLVQKLQAQQ